MSLAKDTKRELPYLFYFYSTYLRNTILPVKFMQLTNGYVGGAVAAIQYTISRGARIINCGWNFDDSDGDLYNLMKENPDVLFVCSAENTNLDLDRGKLYPCSYDLENIINVMAMDNTGHPYAVSGYGKNTVHIAAPGVAVKAVVPKNEETYLDGTSVASSFVTAASALMLSVNENLMPSDIKKIIIATAHKCDSLEMLCVAGGYLDIEGSVISPY